MNCLDNSSMIFDFDEHLIDDKSKSRKVKLTMTADQKEHILNKYKTYPKYHTFSKKNIEMPKLIPIRREYQPSPLNKDIIGAGMAEPFTIVQTIHEHLFGDDPIQHLDWLNDIAGLHHLIKELWPDSNRAYLMYQIGNWLQSIGAESAYESLHTYLYDKRTLII